MLFNTTCLIAFVALIFSILANREKRKYFKRMNDSVSLVDMTKYQNTKEN